MASYTHLNISEINQILLEFGLAKGQRSTPMGHGISNSNYKIELETTPPIILKLSNDKTEEQLREEYSIIEHLKQHQYPFAVLPVTNKKKQNIFKYKEACGAIFPFIQGQVLSCTEQTAFQTGKALGLLHSIPTLDQLRPYSQIGQDWKSIQTYLSREGIKDFQSTVRRIFTEQQLQTYQNYSLPWGIVHGDLYYDNLLFYKQELVAVLDFEQAGQGPLLWDLGISLSGNCWDKEKHCINEVLATGLIEGYESVRPLTVLEKEHLDVAIIFGFLSVALWRIQRFVEKKIDINKYYSYRVLLERALIVARKL